jgi:hypothetical protein
MKLNEEVASLMDDLANGLTSSIKSIENGAREFDPDEAFGALVNIAEMKRQIREVEDAINELFVAWMRLNGEKVRDYGSHVAERKVSSSRKNWEHKTLLEAVVNMSLEQEDSRVIDPSTGEVIDLIQIAKPLVDNVVKNLADAAAIRDWRVTALRAMIPGLNPDDFCEVEKSERVSIRRKS